MLDFYFLAIYAMIKIIIIIIIYPLIYLLIKKYWNSLKYTHQIYVVSNLIKCIILFYLCMSYYHKFYTIL